MNKAERWKWKNAGSNWESNLGPLTSATSALTTELRQSDNIVTNYLHGFTSDGVKFPVNYYTNGFGWDVHSGCLVCDWSIQYHFCSV